MLPMCKRTKELFSKLKYSIAKQDLMSIDLDSKGNHFVIDTFRRSTDRVGKSIRVAAGSGMLEVIQRIPEKQIWLGDIGGHYNPHKCGATDCTVELIAELVPKDNLIFESQDAKDLFTSILIDSKLADSCAVIIADYKANQIIPEHHFELNAAMPLSGYQQVGLCAQQRQKGFGLFMEQGTGKTPIGVAAVCNGSLRYAEQRQPGLYKAIVVCPNTVRANWVAEFTNFATRPGRVTILKGTQLDRVRLLCDAFNPEGMENLYYSVVICGYQTLWRTWESLRMLEWDLSILDEAHAIKGVKAVQSEGCMELRDHSKQRIVMTGTPIANSPLDVYNLLEFMEKNGSGFSSYKEFKKFYGTFERAPTGHEILTGFQNLPFLQERLARKSFFISKKEALPDLPDKTYDLCEVEMTPAQTEAYNKLSRDLALSIENELNTSTLQRSMLVQNILTQMLRLSQITSGFASWDELLDLDGECIQPKFYEYFSPNPKIEAVLEMLREKGTDDKTIIWANWIPDIEYLAHACDLNGIGNCVFRGLHKGYKDEDRQEAVRRFNEDRDCKVFIGTAGSGGSGLNLLGYPAHRQEEYTTNTNHIIYFSQDWSYIKRSQSEDRGHRRGTRVSVRYTTIVVPDSIDTQIHDKVTDKRASAIETADLRKILKEALKAL